MYRYKAAQAIFTGAFVDDFEPARERLTMCDQITIYADGYDSGGQIMEVYEHLLHTITNSGFPQTWSDQWGITTSSDLYEAMSEAIANGVYDVSSYADIGDSEAQLTIELQEFAYWGLATIYGVINYSDAVGAEEENEEWTLSTADEVETQLPLFWALHTATSGQVMAAPTDATLVQLGLLANGGSADTAPWPIIAPGRGTVGGAVAPTDPCKIPSCSSSGNVVDGDYAIIVGVVVGVTVVAGMVSAAAAKRLLKARRRRHDAVGEESATEMPQSTKV
jgi:hypothetical protein